VKLCAIIYGRMDKYALPTWTNAPSDWPSKYQPNSEIPPGNHNTPLANY